MVVAPSFTLEFALRFDCVLGPTRFINDCLLVLAPSLSDGCTESFALPSLLEVIWSQRGHSCGTLRYRLGFHGHCAAYVGSSGLRFSLGSLLVLFIAGLGF